MRRALEALEADVREAFQHRAAALEVLAERQAELEAAIRRAAELRPPRVTPTESL